MKILYCVNCGERPLVMAPGGVPRTPASNCPTCSLCCLEWRWETSEWARRRDVARAKVREAEDALAAANRELVAVVAESRRVPADSSHQMVTETEKR